MTTMQFEDSLRDALRRDAVDLVPVGPGPDDARRRALRRRRRRQGGGVVLVTAALVGASLAIIDTRSSGSDARVTAQPPVTQPAPDLVWRSVDGTVLYDTAHFTTSDGVTYALSTAPGVPADPTAIQPQELYATNDGVAWTHTSLGASPWIADLTSSNGVLYALGTGPGAQAGSTAYKLSTSADGGERWNDDPIPLSFTPPAASVRLEASTSVHIARGPHTTVVIATADYSPDLASVVGNGPWVATSSGVQMIGGDLCGNAPVAAGASTCKQKVVATHPWSEFGISDPVALHQQEAIVRDDGGTWQTVPLPAASGEWVQDVAATSKGFLLAESLQSTAGRGSEVLLTSADGQTWTPLNGVPNIDSVAISGDRVIGVKLQTSDVYVSNDAGATWVSAPDFAGLIPGSAPIEPFTTTVDAGPLGYAVVAFTHEQTTGATAAPNSPDAAGHTYLFDSNDGSSWKITDLAEVGEPPNATLASTSVGADHVDLTFQQALPGDGGAVKSWKLVTLVGTPKA
ncbi:MAG TPA: hypothetical protein VL119_06335 [Acidimicrobiia bacterium]|nr:hypothetical protein [Acidimicrobiia bacterium]